MRTFAAMSLGCTHLAAALRLSSPPQVALHALRGSARTTARSSACSYSYTALAGTGFLAGSCESLPSCRISWGRQTLAVTKRSRSHGVRSACPLARAGDPCHAGRTFTTRRRMTTSRPKACGASSHNLAPEGESIKTPIDCQSRDTPDVTGAYVHLPFCKKKCLYCDFPVKAVGGDLSRPAVSDAMERYISAVLKEMRITLRAVNQDKPLDTIFFGGGTPSLVPPILMERLISALDDRFGIASDAEISMEVDPGTFTSESLRAYQSLGVTRFSVGIQSFEEELLSGVGRSHGLQDVHEALAVISEVSPATWSLDLMSGLPHLTMARWKRTLQQAVNARPPHISVYDLQVEEGTPFARMYTPAEAPLPSDNLAADMYAEASRVLRSAGYEHYELSNYALPGHRCRHNMIYWTGREFYAFGLGAASYLGGARFARPRQMSTYYQWVDSLSLDSVFDLPEEVARETDEDRLLDMVMLRLRLRDGLDLGLVANMFGTVVAEDIAASLARHVDNGFVEVVQRGGGDVSLRGSSCVRLTDPRGLLVSNDIISDIFAVVSD